MRFADIGDSYRGNLTTATTHTHTWEDGDVYQTRN